MSRLVLLAGLFLLVCAGFQLAQSHAESPSTGTAASHSDPAHAHDAITDSSGHALAKDPKDGIVDFQIPLSVATAIVFLGLMLLLSKYAWGPMTKALDERERFHEETLARSENARAEGERLLAEHRQLMSRAQDDVRSMMDEARRNAETIGHSIVTKAQEEAEASRQRAERDIAHARDQALVEIWSKSANLAVDVAGKVLSREVTPDDHKRLLERAIKELPVSPAGERRS